MLKKILIADEDAIARSMLNRALQTDEDIYQVLEAGDEYQTLNALQLHAIDLLVIDPQFSTEDTGFLLKSIRREHPGLVIFVTTAFGTTEVRSRIKQMNGCAYFEKPFDLNPFVKSIQEAVGSKPETSVIKGSISGLRFSTFLSLIQAEKPTCKVRITDSDQTGTLWIVNGMIRRAAIGRLTGDAAVSRMKTWNRVRVEIQNQEPDAVLPVEVLPPSEQPDPSTLKPAVIDEPAQPTDTAPQNEDAFSEHYQMTQKFIGQIEQLQDKLDAMTRQPTELEPPRKRPRRLSSQAAYQVLDILKKEPTIINYRIYDHKDHVNARFSDADPRLENFRPSDYWKLAASLQRSIGQGRFRHLAMKNQNQRHILFPFRKKWFFLIVNNDFQFQNFMEKLTRGISV